jgi:hypothetical protein
METIATLAMYVTAGILLGSMIGDIVIEILRRRGIGREV